MALLSASCTIRYADSSTPCGSGRGVPVTSTVTARPAASALATSSSSRSRVGWGPGSSSAPSARSTPTTRRSSRSPSVAVARMVAKLRGGLLGRPVGGGLGLDGDDRHVVGDHVVQLAGDPAALLEQGPAGPFGVADALLLGQPALGLAAPTQRARGDQDDGRQRGHLGQVGGGVQPGHPLDQDHPGPQGQQPQLDQHPRPGLQADQGQHAEVGQQARLGPHRPGPSGPGHLADHHPGEQRQPEPGHRPVQGHHQGQALDEAEDQRLPDRHAAVVRGLPAGHDPEHDGQGQRPAPGAARPASGSAGHPRDQAVPPRTG